MEFLGVIAATLTTISFLPQTIKTIKDKDTSGISLAMYASFTLGVFSWFIYGLYIGDVPVVAANFVTFIFAVIILSLKLKYK